MQQLQAERDPHDKQKRPDELHQTFHEMHRGTSLSHYGAEEARTPDLFNAIEALSQLSYSPTCLFGFIIPKFPELFKSIGKNLPLEVLYSLEEYSLADTRSVVFYRHYNALKTHHIERLPHKYKPPECCRFTEHREVCNTLSSPGQTFKRPDR